MISLEKQLEEHLKVIKQNDKNKEYLDAKRLKEIFLAGFKNQLNFNIEHFFDFNVIPDNENGLLIECSLNKQPMNVTCKLFTEFLLKENEELTQQLLSDKYTSEIKPIATGLAQSE